MRWVEKNSSAKKCIDSTNENISDKANNRKKYNNTIPVKKKKHDNTMENYYTTLRAMGGTEEIKEAADPTDEDIDDYTASFSSKMSKKEENTNNTNNSKDNTDENKEGGKERGWQQEEQTRGHQEG